MADVSVFLRFGGKVLITFVSMMEKKDSSNAYRFRLPWKTTLLCLVPIMAIVISTCTVPLVREAPRTLFNNYFDTPIRYPLNPDNPINWHIVSIDSLPHA